MNALIACKPRRCCLPATIHADHAGSQSIRMPRSHANLLHCLSVSLMVIDMYGQATNVTTHLSVNPIPAPSASITGSPFFAAAGDATELNANTSVCTTGNRCAYAWTIQCPGKANVTKTGKSQGVTTGVGAGADVNLYGVAPTFTCSVTLRVTGDFGLTHSAQTTLQVGGAAGRGRLLRSAQRPQLGISAAHSWQVAALLSAQSTVVCATECCSRDGWPPRHTPYL